MDRLPLKSYKDQFDDITRRRVCSQYVWTIGREVSSGYEVVSGQLRLWQGGPALHSSAQLAIVDQQPRQMASNQTALLAFGLD